MTLEEKYRSYKELYFKNFVHKGSWDEQGSNIPIERINFTTKYGFVGDGTINLSEHIQYIYAAYLNGEFTKDDVLDAIKTLNRLCSFAYTDFIKDYPKYYFKYEPGFFLRDDLKSEHASLFNLNSIDSSYSRGVEKINEDPCHSTYVSQDQVWNLIPILSYLRFDFPEANELGKNITEYVVKNHHKIYNPYYSAVLHDWTYVPTFDEDKVKAWERVDDRNNHLEYTVKVKRGANNWYFSYGMKKAYNVFGGDSCTFWSSLWYKPFIFLADRIYHPYICKWFNLPVKNTSYYSFGSASGAWYFGNFDKRLISKFNKSLEEDDYTAIFMPQLAFLSNRISDIKLDKVLEWLNKYPEPDLTSTEMRSPSMFLALYNWYKFKTKTTK